MKATQSFIGILNILLQKSLIKKLQTKKDEFNTNNTDNLFIDFLESKTRNSELKILNDNSSLYSINTTDLSSFKYYLFYLDEKYIIK